MKSYQVIDFGRPLRETDLPDPSRPGHEVVVAVKAAGVCHSDLHIWEGSYDLGRGKRMMLKDRGIPLPLTLGHETAGEIVSVGAEGRRPQASARACSSIPGSAAALPRLPRRATKISA